MHGEDEKQESPADRMVPACTGFPTSASLVGLKRLRRLTYCDDEDEPDAGGVDDMAPLLLLSAGAAGAALLSAGGDAIGAAGGAAAGAVESWLLLHADSTSAAAIALRTSFVFIDESPEGM